MFFYMDARETRTFSSNFSTLRRKKIVGIYPRLQFLFMKWKKKVSSILASYQQIPPWSQKTNVKTEQPAGRPPHRIIRHHSLIRGVLIQSCSARGRNFTKYVFFHVQFGGLVQNSQNYCAISVKFKKNDFLLYKID